MSSSAGGFGSRAPQNSENLGDYPEGIIALLVVATMLPFRQLYFFARRLLVGDFAQNMSERIQPRPPLIVGMHDIPRRPRGVGREEHLVAPHRVVEPSDESVYRVLQDAIEKTPHAHTLNWEEKFMLAANGAFLFRGLRYAGHANSLWKNENRAAVYSASPGRVGAIAAFLNEPSVANIPFLQTTYLDLIEGLSLPKTGYNWDFLPERMRPISDQTLSEMLVSLEPRKALEKVLAIRESSEGKRIREIWASRLWNKGRSCIEGGSSGQSIAHSQIHGPVVQIAIAKESSSSGDPSYQTVRSSIIRGEIHQYASARAIQRADESEADELTQTIEARLLSPASSIRSGGVQPERLGLFRKIGARLGVISRHEEKVVHGTVKRFLTQRGYGFIVPDEGGADIFVGQATLKKAGVLGLFEGQRVLVTVEMGDKGPRATSIRVQ
jgi:cold shock CspA family protein